MLAGDADRLIGWMRRGTVGLGGLLALLALLVVFFSLVEPTTFPRGTTLQAIMFQVPELGLLSLAMAIPLISGGINLAIIATANLSGLLMAWILIAVMPPEAAGRSSRCGWSSRWPRASSVCGHRHRHRPAGRRRRRAPDPGDPRHDDAASRHQHLFHPRTHAFGISRSADRRRQRDDSRHPDLFLLFTLVAAAVHVFLTRSALGIRIHMTGSNPEATRFSGVDTARVLISVYLLSSLLCWLAAVVMMARFNAAGADIAQSYLLITVLAAILGGIDPYGGFGRIAGLFVALIILQVIASGFNIMGLSPHLALACWGGILLLVVAIKRIRLQ